MIVFTVNKIYNFIQSIFSFKLNRTKKSLFTAKIKKENYSNDVCSLKFLLITRKIKMK